MSLNKLNVLLNNVSSPRPAVWGGILLAFAVLFSNDQVDGRQCYFSSTGSAPPNTTQPSKLPENATIETCGTDADFCVKIYMYTVVIGQNGDTNYSVSYQWTCTILEELPLPSTFKCDNGWEYSMAERSRAEGTVSYHYGRVCPCCGDLCNGASMDDICNEQPQYTKKCYAAGLGDSSPDDTNILPGRALEIPCTATQSCMKTTTLYNNMSMYSWGCSTPPQGVCGSSVVEKRGDNMEKICTCCGDFCNGHLMDSILANDSLCGDNADTTTASLISTTAVSPPSNNDDMVILIGAILGSLLALTLAGLGVAIFFIFRFRFLLEHNKPDRVKFVKESDKTEISSPKPIQLN